MFKLGFIEKNKGNLSTSLRYFNKAKEIFKETNNSEAFASIHFDIGYVYRYKKQIDKEFEPGHGAGVRWNDVAFGIEWPEQPAVIAERDADFPEFGDKGGKE